jgi:hypothetical protein
MLRHKEVVEAKFVGENSLPHLREQSALARLMNFGEIAVVDCYPRRGPDHREIGCTIVKNAYFDHMPSDLIDRLSLRLLLRGCR